MTRTPADRAHRRWKTQRRIDAGIERLSQAGMWVLAAFLVGIVALAAIGGIVSLFR